MSKTENSTSAFDELSVLESGDGECSRSWSTGIILLLANAAAAVVALLILACDVKLSV